MAKLRSLCEPVRSGAAAATPFIKDVSCEMLVPLKGKSLSCPKSQLFLSPHTVGSNDTKTTSVASVEREKVGVLVSVKLSRVFFCAAEHVLR